MYSACSYVFYLIVALSDLIKYSIKDYLIFKSPTFLTSSLTLLFSSDNAYFKSHASSEILLIYFYRAGI